VAPLRGLPPPAHRGVVATADLDPVAAHFEATLAAHGPTARGADWRDDSSREERFRLLDRLVLDDGVESVCELGCGYGAYLDHLRAAGYRGTYVGVDVTPAMIGAAIALHPDDRFEIGSAARPADVVVASGIFNVRGGNGVDPWSAHVDATVDAMWDVARQGVVFNVLTQDCQPGDRAEDFHYVDVDAFVPALARLPGGTVEVRRDFGTHELTVFVLR
jgi:SAM-dependent methyltransferase